MGFQFCLQAAIERLSAFSASVRIDDPVRQIALAGVFLPKSSENIHCLALLRFSEYPGESGSQYHSVSQARSGPFRKTGQVHLPALGERFQRPFAVAEQQQREDVARRLRGVDQISLTLQ
jgi:hypothetical protein